MHDGYVNNRQMNPALKSFMHDGYVNQNLVLRIHQNIIFDIFYQIKLPQSSKYTF